MGGNTDDGGDHSKAPIELTGEARPAGVDGRTASAVEGRGPGCAAWSAAGRGGRPSGCAIILAQ